jgi:hypothetical protein
MIKDSKQEMEKISEKKKLFDQLKEKKALNNLITKIDFKEKLLLHLDKFIEIL